MKKTIEAVENALTFLESLGYREGGDIHDDLAAALEYLRANQRVLRDLFNAAVTNSSLLPRQRELNAAVQRAAAMLESEA